jgi:hypothetical protein
MKKLLFAMAIGAALAWLFDPDAGSRRRDQIRRKLDERGLTGPASSPPTVPTAVADHTATLASAGR